MRVVSFGLAAAIAASIALTAACGPRTQHAQQMAEADVLFARACYTCLTRAFRIYDTLRLAGFQPAVITRKAFDAAILIAMRETELGMAASPWIEKAAALAPKPGGASGAAATRAALYLDMTRNARWAAGKLDADEASIFERAVAAGAIASLGDWETALGTPDNRDLVGTYLMASLACAYTPPTRQLSELVVERLAPAHRNAALMKYAVGICKADLSHELEALEGDRDFIELLYRKGRMRLFRVDGTARQETKTLLTSAHAAMPQAVANSYLLAGVHLSLEEFAECAARYDDVIRHGGARRDSMLDRTKCLTRGWRF